MADLTLAQMLTRLADNAAGEISATDVQEVVQALFERTDGTNAVAGLLFDTTAAAPAHTPGHLHWNDTDGMLEIMSGTTGVTLQVGQEQWVASRNQSGSAILNGTPVRESGASGNRPLIVPDDGQGNLLGIATHDIADNGNGKVTTFGLVRDVDTSAFSAGDSLYVTSAGAFTTAFTPSFAGVVINDHATQGVILARPASFDHADGTTAARPTTVSTGFMYFDTTLGLPIWWSGAAWVDATGGAV